MARKEYKGLLTCGDRGKSNFRYRKDIHCMGRMGTGNCMDCMKINQMHALTCKNLGDYLPKDDWNRIIGNGAMQQYDRRSQARSSFEEELTDGKITRYDKFGLPIGPNGC